MSGQTLAWIAVGCVLISWFAATGARSLAEFAPHELREICKRRKRPRRLPAILRSRTSVWPSLVGLHTLAGAGYVAAAVLALSGGVPPTSLPTPWSIAAIVVGLLVAEVWLPSAIARLWANEFLAATWPIWQALSVPLLPIIWGAHLSNRLFERLSGRHAEEPDEESFEDDIRTFVSEGHREGLLEEDAREMIEGIMDLDEADVSEIMTPRTDVVCMPRSLTWPEMLDFVISAGHTRVPVFHKSRDDIVGILHTKDLLPELAKGPGERREAWTTLLRAPFFVPETKPINAILEDFQRTRNHIAIVLDEYGGVSGLITLEDVLEEIVGEIVDEYDHEEVEWIQPVSEGVYEAYGRARLDDLNERMGLSLPEDEEFDTIAGFVFHELGRVPTAGEELVWQNVRITVLEASPRRIEKVRLEVIDPSTAMADTSVDGQQG
ncbi:MAG: hemolysin family protein [Planctomycetota bacterium]